MPVARIRRTAGRGGKRTKNRFLAPRSPAGDLELHRSFHLTKCKLILRSRPAKVHTYVAPPIQQFAAQTQIKSQLTWHNVFECGARSAYSNFKGPLRNQL